jgi:four helix bundle protein
MFQFQRFPVYILAESFYQKVQPLLSEVKVSNSMRDQLDRAASSIMLNIAEGAGKYNSKDKKNFYVVARGSVNECVAILEIFRIKKVLSDAELNLLNEELTTMAKMLTGLIKRMLASNLP